MNMAKSNNDIYLLQDDIIERQQVEIQTLRAQLLEEKETSRMLRYDLEIQQLKGKYDSLMLDQYKRYFDVYSEEKCKLA